MPHDPLDGPIIDGPSTLQAKFAKLVDMYNRLFKDAVSTQLARVTPFDPKVLRDTVSQKL